MSHMHHPQARQHDLAQQPGRSAGWLYFLVSFPAPFSLLYVPGKIIVHGNATATAANIVAHETLFRLGIAGQLVSTALFILVPLALYHLLRGVNKRLASLMVILILVSIPV